MKILVTGGAGFIGSNFVRNFHNNLYPKISQITVLDNLSYAGNLKNLDFITDSKNAIKFIEGDICDFKLINLILKDIDIIVNFAAESHVDRSIVSSKEFVLSNIVGVQNILDSMLNQKNEIKLVHVSTDEIYGDVKIGNASENYGYFPNSPYSASKASAELLIRSYIETHKIKAIITRGCNTFGPNQNTEKLIPKTISNILLNKKVPIYGTGENIREWIYVDNHCDAIYNIACKDNSNEIYNIGSGTLLSNLSIVKKVIKLMDADESIIEYVVDRKGHDFRYAMDSEKYNKEFQPKMINDINLELKKTIYWYMNNSEHWQ